MTIRKVKPMAEALEEWQLSRSQERERQLALLRLPHEELVAKLWQRHMIPDGLVPAALDMSDAYWQGLKKSGNAPARIAINGLRYVLTSDLLEWVKRQPKTLETKQRRGKKRNAYADNETRDYCHPTL